MPKLQDSQDNSFLRGNPTFRVWIGSLRQALVKSTMPTLKGTAAVNLIQKCFATGRIPLIWHR